MQIGFPGLLALIFITLKLTNFIDWSWWWVLAPIWIPILIAALVVFVAAYFGTNITIKKKEK